MSKLSDDDFVEELARKLQYCSDVTERIIKRYNNIQTEMTSSESSKSSKGDSKDSPVNSNRATTKVASVGTQATTLLDELESNDDQTFSSNWEIELNNLNDVLPMVLRYLDQPSVGVCRLVCKTWNEKVIPFYSDTFWITFGLYNKRFTTAESHNKIKSLASTWTSGSPGLVGKLKFSFEFLRMKRIMAWFQIFGSQLKSLYILGPINHGKIYSTLLNCPNLKELVIENLNFHPEDLSPVQFKGVFHTELKLKQIFFIGGGTNCFEHYSDGNSVFLADIVSASPELEHLTTSFGDSYGSFDAFLMRLRQCGKVTQNLQSWTFGSNSFMIPLTRQITAIEHISLGKKLSRLHLNDFKDYYYINRNGWIDTGLQRTLMKLRNSLKTLILSGAYIALLPPGTSLSFGLLQQCGKEIVLPFMEKLEVFENWTMHCFTQNNLTFIQKMPYIRKLVLSALPAERFQLILTNPGNNILIENPHRNLQELHLMQEINHSFQLFNITKIFPNLKILRFTVSHGFNGFNPSLMELKRSSSSDSDPLLDCLQRLTDLETLSIEFLDILNPALIHQLLWNSLDKIESLKLVILMSNNRSDEQNLISQQILMTTIVDGIFRVKNLKQLEMYNFVITMNQLNDLQSIAKKRGINLMFRP